MSKAKMEAKALPKRFYVAANYVPHEGGFVVQLDGKNVRTPQQKLLQHKSEKLVQQIVAEWDAQKELIDADTMPLTRLLNIALDRIAADRAALVAEAVSYGETDLLFYRAEGAQLQRTLTQPSPLEGEGFRAEAPIVHSFEDAAAELAALQHEYFTPVLDWVKAVHGVGFTLTEGVMPVAQPAASLEKLADLFGAATDHELAGLSMMVPLLGSALLTLAVWQGEIDIERALVMARLDEAVQEKKWGADPETVAAWAMKCRDARAAAFFLTCK